VVYHAAAAFLFAASAFWEANTMYWRTREFQIDLLFVVLLYPATVPFFFVCGGLHNHGTTTLGRTIQLSVLGISIVWYVIGWWVLASVIVRRFRSPESRSPRNA